MFYFVMDGRFGHIKSLEHAGYYQAFDEYAQAIILLRRYSTFCLLARFVFLKKVTRIGFKVYDTWKSTT